MKRFLACFLTLALLLGCVGFASAEEQTTVRIVWWGSQVRHDATVAALEKFMEKYPNIKVEYEFSDWGGYWSKLATQVAGHLEQMCIRDRDRRSPDPPAPVPPL